MEYFEPLEKGFTIYSKPGCSNCTKVKRLLCEKEICFLDVECGDYLLENKEAFLSFIKERANKEYRIFPMVFKDGKFIGGFTETQQLIDKESCFDNIVF
jgi:glutaredoxin